MSHKVTLDLPEIVMARLQRMAQRSHRNVETVLADSIGDWVAGLREESDVNDETYWDGTSIADLAERQGVGPAKDLHAFEAAFWPDNESVDDLICAVAGWRAEDATLS